jgi:hypothetical protein
MRTVLGDDLVSLFGEDATPNKLKIGMTWAGGTLESVPSNMLQLANLKGLIKAPKGARTVSKSNAGSVKRITAPKRRLLASRLNYSNESLAEEEEGDSAPAADTQTLGNIYRHTRADHFDWGAIKERIFGDFGKRPEKPDIRRLSFVPEATSDEFIVPTYVKASYWRCRSLG